MQCPKNKHTDVNMRHNNLPCMSCLRINVKRVTYQHDIHCAKHTEKRPRPSVGNYSLQVTKPVQTNTWPSLKNDKLKQFPTLKIT